MKEMSMEKVISSMEQMIQIEQLTLCQFLKDCLEMHEIEDCILRKAIIQKIQHNALTLANLALATAQINAIRLAEIQEMEEKLRKEKENEQD